MKKRYPDFEQAAIEYKEYFGEVPKYQTLENLYHLYRGTWKAFDGFTDWLRYNT